MASKKKAKPRKMTRLELAKELLRTRYGKGHAYPWAQAEQWLKDNSLLQADLVLALIRTGKI